MNTFIKTIPSEYFFNKTSKSLIDFPVSTYRVQLNHSFTFKDLHAQIPYLHALGISTIYAAPITKATTDSAHGYDVADFSQINPQIGTLEELKLLSATLKKYNMTWIQDIVPNHMAFSSENKFLMDVLERGNYSPYYRFFDINWEHPDSFGKLFIPTLGSDLNAAIEADDIQICFTDAGFSIKYFDTIYPLSISSLAALISVMQGKKIHADFTEEIKSFLYASLSSSYEEFEYIKHRFIYKIKNDENYILEVEWLTKTINKNKALLKALLNQQFYSLVHWKTSETKMNYRRFFTINNLICLRMEDDAVFNEYHAFTSFLYKENIIQGVRVDHIDGLYDPKKYLQRLRTLLGESCYIIAEKILEYNEDIAKDWNIEGTSGYEFLSFTNRVLTDQQGANKIVTFYSEFIGHKIDYDAMAFDKKHTFLYSQMQGELDNLMDLINGLHLLTPATDLFRFRKALGVFMSAFPIYRIYPDRLPLPSEAFNVIETAHSGSIYFEPALEYEFTLIKDLFSYDETTCEQKLKFIRRLMQFTGPLAAKGVEDTTFYVYNPLISHNEVGDAPCELGITIQSFHDKMISRFKNNPYSLNATSTHDTKRGEDARMRINVLSHLADEWKVMITTWHSENAAFIKNVNNKSAPSLNDEYFIYQSLIGSFPENLVIDDSFLDRTKNFLLKALKEAKVETTYTEANDAYEHSCTEFITSILNNQHTFLTTFIPFIEKIMNYGAAYSLAQSVIKITAPGIPDIYQGSELWDISYVDPDNRRPVNYAFRKDLLNEIQTLKNNRPELLAYISKNRFIGAEKMFVTLQLLHLRNELQDTFVYGNYIPVFVSFHDTRKVIAYLRSYKNEHVLVIIPVGFKNTGENYSQYQWDDVFIQMPHGLPNKWINILTDETYNILNSITIAELCTHFSLAVLKNIR
ncbi:MAG TPA: malto-oligosyltrehalose synthase [Cytophaga sp.]|nr:malto-oligosyltrehalose synthase [Cytophaga sp.]